MYIIKKNPLKLLIIYERLLNVPSIDFGQTQDLDITEQLEPDLDILL